MNAPEVLPPRKTNFIIWIVIGVSVLLVLWSLSLPAIGNGLQRSPVAEALSSVKQISLALQQYAIDQKTIDDNAVVYPSRLESLVDADYLSQEDFTKLMKDHSISYFPPPTREAAPNHFLLVYHVKDHVIYGFVSGELQIDKIK